MSGMTLQTAEQAGEVLTGLALGLGATGEEDALWNAIDPAIWAETHNPWTTLARASRVHVRGLLADAAFRGKIAEIAAAREAARRAPGWFDGLPEGKRPGCIAYFSMEYMLSESLPIYSGGLGNVAGDQLKAASDLNVPVVAVGLLFAQGYFRQEFTPDGQQRALYPFNDPSQLPVRPVLDENGDWLRLALDVPAGTIWIRAWQVQVGRATLYLLDTNDPANPSSVRCITTQLYGGDAGLRLRQEIVLGIAGWRLLMRLGYQPEVCHLNEGHAALAAVERARVLRLELGVSFREALMIARAGTVFTTHTAVPAGFDRFPPGLVAGYLAEYVIAGLDMPVEEFIALGRETPGNEAEPFNMAWLAIRVSGAVNGVSALHGEVSRALFAPLFPRWPEAEVPVGHVTNGVHVATWAAPDRGRPEQDDATLWSHRCAARTRFVRKIADQHASRQCFIGEGGLECFPVPALRPDVLTLGFARRFASYKRPDLLLTDPDRLARLLADPTRPMQLVLAGKAHPADVVGQALITRWIAFSRREDVLGRVVFLADYDMELARILVRGVDLWINTPRRPWEACGTSGMKVLANGGLNFSELDGWWAEAFTPEVGWALGDGKEHGEDPATDAAEAEALYHMLETEIAGAFYARDTENVPTAWVKRMRASMTSLTPAFSAERAVQDYTTRYYIPAAARYRRRLDGGAQEARDLAAWRDRLAAQWGDLRFAAVSRNDADGLHHVAVTVELGRLEAGDVRLELYADPRSGAEAEVIDVPAVSKTVSSGALRYELSVALKRPASEYTVRVVPFHSEVMVPLEANFILWEH
ncbi:glucan phosphorylase [Acidomonas methanolica]|uniref:Alpha-glucan phosphorylase n=2 Tax=Acidomonas methanolica TaxID=437 RepID=A0A023D5U1_ACIMT|nr:starch phosphorylase [Acidomonas methanolica]GAJ29512.1 alpha-glucan phosphorylase [Acidomonas methanolica NBRC 104435]GBQ48243.1 glucan phosphorylase [Acidomonas methanolica]